MDSKSAKCDEGAWSDLVDRYIARYSPQIRRATRPLRDHFGVSYFTYHRIDPSGHYTVLVDRPDWAENYVSEQLYLVDPFLRPSHYFQSGLCSIESSGNEEYRELFIETGERIIQSNTGTILIQKSGDGSAEFFGFCGLKGKSCIDSIALNTPHLLDAFADHFKRELRPVLSRVADEGYSLHQLKGERFTAQEPFQSPMHDACIAFLREIEESTVNRAATLSKREREVLNHLLSGSSAKESGLAMGLSHRTVEAYLESAKNKLDCEDKRALFRIAQQLHQFSLIP